MSKTDQELFDSNWHKYFKDDFQKFCDFKNKKIYWDPRIETPIETDFYNSFMSYITDVKWSFPPGLSLEIQCTVSVKSNHQIKVSGAKTINTANDYSYRLDFAFIYNERPLSNVECDGVQYHSSFHYVLNDRLRDERIRALGFSIMRFTGKELQSETDPYPLQVVNALEYLINQRALDDQYEKLDSDIERRQGGGVIGFTDLSFSKNRLPFLRSIAWNMIPND